MTTLDELQQWFQAQCNGDWEHSRGITIQSTDNPGWWVTIDLHGTSAAGKAFVPVLRGDHASLDPQPPWIVCEIKDGVFHGAGDAGQLGEILGIFLGWANWG